MLRHSQQCPAIHGETGLCLLDGGSMQDHAAGSPVPGKAANVMFERISRRHALRCMPLRCLLKQHVDPIAWPCLGLRQEWPCWNAQKLTMQQYGIAFTLLHLASCRISGPFSDGCVGLRAAASQCTWCARGALTNAALLLLLYPEVVPMVAITIMGGCMGVGNTGPVAEFNIQVALSGCSQCGPQCDPPYRQLPCRITEIHPLHCIDKM